MANCIYTLNGRIFNSVLELDNFLLNHKDNITTGNISDIVFSKLHLTKEQVEELLDKKKQGAEQIQELKREIGKIKKLGGSVTFELEQLAGLYIGVNDAMTKFKITRGGQTRLLLNGYDEENLKLHLFRTWADTGISEKHAKLIGEQPGRKIQINDTIAQNDIWNRLNELWKILGKTGTQAHKVMELLWNDANIFGPTENDTIQNIQSKLVDEFGTAATLTKTEIIALISRHARIKSDILATPGFTNAKFYAEYPILADTTYSEQQNQPTKKLLGVIDLLVVDDYGKVHIFDYKFSNNEFNDWAKYKLVAYQYLLGAYKLALEAYGLDTAASEIGVIPLSFNNYDRGHFDNVNYEVAGQSNNSRFGFDIDYSNKLHPSSTIINNLQYFIIDPTLTLPPSSNFMIKTNEDFGKAFPSYRFQQLLTDAIEEDLMRDLEEDPNTGIFRLINPKPWETRTEFRSVEEYKRYLDDLNSNSFRYYHNLLSRAMREGDSSILSQEESKSKLSKYAVSRLWFLKQFELFCSGNGEWELLDIPEFETLGILVLHNVVGGYYKIYSLDNYDPNVEVKFKKGTSILGNFVDDITPESMGIVPLKGDYGNINNMKIMIALNNYPEMFANGEMIEGIYPICPKRLLGHHATSKQLLDNFRMLCSYAGIENNFLKGKIKFLPSYLAAYEIIREYGNKLNNPHSNLNKIFSKYESDALTLSDTLEALLQVKLELEESYPDFILMSDKGPKINFDTPEGKAYAKIMEAITEILNGYYTLTLRDGSKIKHLIDNPEILEHNLRSLYKITTNFHETYKRRMNTLASEFRTLQEKFWKRKGYNITLRNTLNNERQLYESMIERTLEGSGVFRFKNPWDPNSELDDAERDFLKWILDNLAKVREPGLTDALLISRRSTLEYLDVPILRGEGSKNPFTKNGRKGLVLWFKKTSDYIKNFRANIKSGVSNLLDPSDSETAEKTAAAFEIFDIFERSDNPVLREEFLRTHDTGMLDRDIGNIFYMYAGAKIRKAVLDEYMPLLKAQLVLLMMEASLNNINIDNNIDYILKYTKAKIMDMSIVPENYRGLAKVLSKIRAFTTYATLGFSPKSGLFLMMEGVWKNVSRAGFKPLGENQFGKEELTLAVRWLIGDTPDHFKIVSMGELLNEKFAINDMDVSSFAKHLREGLYPLSFASKAMWFTQSPDYFNRMSIFIAQMIKDGCFDAYEKDGMTLKYNWKKDKRFSLFANGINIGSKEYNKLKALYHAMMALFKTEGYQVLDENGNWRDLQFDPTSDIPQDALPEAYTNRDGRNIKSFADQLYGYYNHEDLFLLKSMLLGAQYTLFRTYWSSLKNRWFLRGGVYSNGGWELAKDKDGTPMFKKFNVDEHGNLISTELVTEDTGEPYMIWKGSYLEGIAVTLGECLKSLFDPNSQVPLKERAINILHGKTGNENEDVIRVRATNLKLAAHDLLIWAIVGMLIGWLLTRLLKEQEKADKNKKLGFGDMTLRAAEGVFVSSLVASTLDLGAIKDLASPLTDWNPPSFRVLSNIWEDGGKVITGDKSFVKALVQNIAVLRQTKEYWYKAESALKDEL